jgi:hypothetical protein
MTKADANQVVNPFDKKALSSLSLLSDRLKSVTDELNVAVESIETRLNRLNLGVEAWVTSSPLQQHRTESFIDETGEPVRRRIATELGYTKLPDGWGLAVRTAIYWEVLEQRDGWTEGNQESVSDVKPLLRATRTIRAIAVDRIPELIEALNESGSKLIEAVEKARKISTSLK